MAKRAPTSYEDVQARAAGSLDDALRAAPAADAGAGEEGVPVEVALRDTPVLQYDSGRSKTRVLFVTSDASFLNPTTDALRRFYDVARQFDEMHIIVLRPGIAPKHPVLRVRGNIWLYIAHAEFWWWTPVIANEVVAENQLVFAAGFRPDLIVALEPFEAGLAAQWIGQAHDRPVQIHVREDYLTRAFRRRTEHARWRRLIAWWVLRRAPSICVATESLREKLAQRFSPEAPVAVLPRFHGFKALREAPVTADLHQKYPAYETILLYIGPLTYECALYGLLDAAKFALANPRVGLVVVGDGRARQELEAKVAKLGLATQVAFEREAVDLPSYLKSADVLLVPDTDGDSDEATLMGAVAGLPMLMAATEQRTDLFTDGESAYLCPAGDTKCFTQKLTSLLREEGVRPKMEAALAALVARELHEDPLAYRQAYRELLESVFFISDDRLHNDEDNQRLSEGKDSRSLTTATTENS